MSENEELKEVEQLEDVEFEKENEQKKKKSKKKNIIILIISLLLVAVAAFGIYYFVFKSTPTVAVNDFIIAFNAEDYDKCLELIDLQGNFALTATGENEEIETIEDAKKYYTRFDSKYEDVKNTEDYKELTQLMSEIKMEEVKEFFDEVRFNITSSEKPVRIQNTKGLYKISANVDIKESGKTESQKVEFYVNKSGREYKLVGGDLVDLFLFYSYATILYNNL